MTKFRAFLFVVLLFIPLSAFSKEKSASVEEEESVSSINSLDLHTLFTSLMNQGWGIGYSWEQQIFTHFAFKLYIAHSSFNTGEEGIYCSTVSGNFFVEVYPLSTQMKRLYISIGGYQDWLNYYKQDSLDVPGDGAAFSAGMQVGYKISLPLSFVIDVFVGYKYSYYFTCNLYGSTTDYIKQGIQYGVYLRHIITRI